MAQAATLTSREVAALAGTPERLVEKAIEEGVLRAHRVSSSGAPPRGRRMLPIHAVAYAALIGKLGLQLTKAHKKRLIGELARLAPSEFRTGRVELAPAVEVDVGRLIGDLMDRAERYRNARDRLIVSDEDIKGGTPIIRGTRITVYSVLGRIDHGETADDVLSDNPDLSREAIDAAITFARTHPPIGRPSGRPWADPA